MIPIDGRYLRSYPVDAGLRCAACKRTDRLERDLHGLWCAGCGCTFTERTPGPTTKEAST